VVAWRVLVPEGSRQVADDEWNYWVRRLCPADVQAAHIETLWWEPVSVGEALDARGDVAVHGPVRRDML